MMRDQGIAANATPRSVRGQSNRADRDASFRTRERGSSHALSAQVESIATEISKTGTIRDPARSRLLETRKAVVAGWLEVAATLHAQGESSLASDVHYFANHLPRLLTDRERLAEQWVRFLAAQSRKTGRDDRIRERTIERTR